ncbi:acyl-CoA dehydrogenase [Nocardia gipuzkoensis]|uniref:acyl-CoA dehydrogenase n=1 Tax=Nocardia gipuzkoensis TaxID=2749991 RepID=UPI001C67E668|nr:acyl-CoA dehydrogenase [Nocardia gipuzkoensis]
MMLVLLNPHKVDFGRFDAETARLLQATIDWFESRGKQRLLADYHAKRFYADFLDFQARERIFATLLTPARDADGDEHKRWDTARVAAMSEILGFYGLNYWYPWQVTVLGLGPVWQSDNAEARAAAATALEAGGVAAFGLSEQAHGADIYSSDMVLTPDGNGGWLATGSKYYIGNGNCARTVSVFGRIDGVTGSDQYVFFMADSEHPNYYVVKNVVPSQMYVAEFRLENYPVRGQDILHTGHSAFSAALNTVNIGKFNLCFGGIGLATHALYEAISHAHHRILYGAPVTTMPHIRTALVESYARLIGMRLFCDRAIDYFRSAGRDDRRYLLFNPITKMKATTEAEKIMALLGDVVAAKGFESDNYLAVARIDVTGLPKLEGTAAVNLALVLKFMPTYLFAPQDYPPVATRADAADDDFLFRQGPARGLGKIRFHDWRTAYAARRDIANVALLTEQANGFAQLLTTATPDAAQQADMDFTLVLGELFTIIAYGHLILEQAEIVGLDDGLLDVVFGVLVGDFSRLAVDLIGKRGSTEAQQRAAQTLIRKAVTDEAAFDRVWRQVVALDGAYEMNP